MWRYAIWFIIIGLVAMVFLGWCVYYWRARRDEIEDQQFEEYRMRHEERMRERDGDS